MKLAIFLCVISISAFAQQKDKPVNYLDRHLDSLDLDFDWKRELYNTWDCYCPWLKVDSIKTTMPRELSPYKWGNKDQPIIIDDSTYQQWIKSDLDFKKMYQRADSLRKGQDSIRVIKKKPVALLKTKPSATAGLYELLRDSFTQSQCI